MYSFVSLTIHYRYATLINLSGRVFLLGGRHLLGAPHTTTVTMELLADGNSWEERSELEMTPDGSQEFLAIVYNVDED